MTIYIESFLIQNILINYCLLRLVELTTKSKSNLFRLIISSIVGASASIIVSMFLTNNMIVNLLKMLTSLAMIKLAFKVKIKSFIFNFILLFVYTYALGGAIMGLTSSVYFTNVGVVMNSRISLEVICLILIALTYIFELVAKSLKQKMLSGRFIYQLTLYLGNKHLTINAYLDTGNLLNYNNKPVVLVDLSSYIKLADINLINYYLTNTDVVKTATVNGNNYLKVVKLDKLEIKNGKNKKTIPDQYIAITNNIKADNYSALISPSLI